ncbi:MAG TPA: peptide chain release factor N(5)-glutamine methyltransferase, partial [Chryseolinea sp.]|nr:peptide chain release factor N(5)-glutamine methyltransferase [Chryseolinea sp.]
MKNSKALFHDLVKQIMPNEDLVEKQSITYQLMENIFGLTQTDILSEKHIDISAFEILLADILKRINSHEPLQYILGEAYFFGRKFKVNSSVLIPRPETEELVNLIISEMKRRPTLSTERIRIMDIGTGSGCIPISLGLEIQNAEVFAIDISEGALEVAKQNAHDLHAGVQFMQLDILNADIPFQNLDVVVSNPPYIALSEMKMMSNNVVDYEPHLALFVEENDPLVFYRVIATKSKSVLKPGGLLVVEINERF